METPHKEISLFLANTSDPVDISLILGELFTAKEIKTLNLRWELMKDLASGMTQRAIAEKHRISLCKITRGSKILKNPQSITGKFLKE